MYFVPPGLLESEDYVLYFKPNFRFLLDALQEGRFPLWNPYVGLGRPFFSDVQNAVLYPPLYLIVFGLEVGVFLLVWLHCLLAALGMRALAGVLQVGRWQGYLMAFTFLTSAFFVVRWMVGAASHCWAMSYLPTLLYCAIRTEEPWHRRRIGCYAALLALQFLCGHPQMFWYSVVGQAAFIFCRALRWPPREALRDLWQGFSQFGMACLWCVGLVAVVLLPFLVLVQEGNRAGVSPSFASFGKLAWKDLWSLLHFSSLHQADLFIGGLATLAGVAGCSRVRERNVRGLFGVLVIALVMALADGTPLFGLLYDWLPGYSSFRLHARAGVLVVLALICQAGIWLSRPHPRLRAAWPADRAGLIRYFLAGLVVLQVVDLFQTDWRIKKSSAFSKRFGGISPDFPLQRQMVAKLREAGLMKPFQPPPRISSHGLLIPLNGGMIHHFSHFDAYTSLFLKRPWEYLHRVQGLQPSELRNSFVSEEIYLRGAFPYPDLAISAGVDTRTGTLHLATNASPRAFLVHAARVVGDPDSILAQLAQGHDIHQCALLEKPLASQLPAESSLPGAAVPIRHFEPNSILIDVEAKAPALLVLAEAWYPGWKAEIDGQVFETLPANAWMRAVPVPAGRHQVRVFFRENCLLTGTVISLLSVGLFVAGMRDRKWIACQHP